MPDPGPEEFSQVLFKVADLLEGLGAPYFIFGAVAVGIWGRIRTTLDVDFLVRTDEEGLSRLEAAAESSGIGVDRLIEEQKGRLDEEYLDLWARRLYVEQELAYVMRGGTVG